MLAGVAHALRASSTRRPQNRFSGSPVDAELLHELIERDAVREPVEEMLHGKLTALPRKHGAPLITVGIHPYRLFQLVIVAFIVWCLRSQWTSRTRRSSRSHPRLQTR